MQQKTTPRVTFRGHARRNCKRNERVTSCARAVRREKEPHKNHVPIRAHGSFP